MRETNEQRGDGPAVATDIQSEAQPRLEAVPQPPPSPDGVGEYKSLGYRAKRLLLGPPFKTTQLVHERISKRVALAVFSSDPISSTAYATEEMLLVLVTAGTAAVSLALPLAAGVAVLLMILVLSYRQVIDAYAAGTTALTGVEAIADGVPAFRKPEARNAQRTLTAMALIMAFLFLGITFLAIQLHARPFREAPPTLVAQIAQHVLGSGVGHLLFLFVQIATL